MRIRSIKPDFWRSEDISSLEIADRLLFIGLWSYVDDNGVGQDRVSLIAADLFADDLSRDPRDTLARVTDGLQRLSEAGRIVRYTVDGRDYIAVTNWKKHQRIDKPNKPRFPEPTSENVTVRDTLATPSRDTRDTLAPGTGEQGNRGTEERVSAHASRPHPLDPHGTSVEEIPDTTDGYPSGFEEFWATYPRPVGKREAFAAWFRALKRIRPDDLLAATRQFAEFHRADGTNERFIPHPKTWLERDGWNDKLTPRNRPDGPQTRQQRTDEQVLQDMLQTPQNGTHDVIDGEIINPQQRQIG